MDSGDLRLLQVAIRCWKTKRFRGGINGEAFFAKNLLSIKSRASFEWNFDYASTTRERNLVYISICAAESLLMITRLICQLAYVWKFINIAMSVCLHSTPNLPRIVFLSFLAVHHKFRSYFKFRKLFNDFSTFICAKKSIAITFYWNLWRTWLRGKPRMLERKRQINKQTSDNYCRRRASLPNWSSLNQLNKDACLEKSWPQ